MPAAPARAGVPARGAWRRSVAHLLPSLIPRVGKLASHLVTDDQVTATYHESSTEGVGDPAGRSPW